MKKKRGFTLLEILVALSLFLVGMVSILQIFPINRKLIAQNGEMTQAVFLAQEQIEKIQATSYSDVMVGSFESRHYLKSSGEPLSQFERETSVNLMDSSYNNSNTDIGLKKVVVTVYWKQGNIDRQYTLPVIVTNKQ